MTRFGIVVTAYAVADHLIECLHSIAEQSLRDFEVAVVVDASPDACGEIADGFAAADPRFTSVQLTERIGMGGARNIGMDRTSGEYTVFLDGDDLFSSPFALETIASALTARPDVLMYDFTYQRHCGIPKISNLTRILPGRSDTFRLRDEPAALKVSWVAWNKTYRSAFLRARSIRFPPGYYEDSVWSCLSLLQAASIGILPRVCTSYRCCRPDSASRRPGRQHLDVFDQYDRILSFLTDRPELGSPEIRATLVACMEGFLGSLRGSRMVIPDEAREDFDALVARFHSAAAG